MISRCLKITEKVSFNIASEASYVYILSGQNFGTKKSFCLKKIKMRPFCGISDRCASFMDIF